MNYNPLEQEKNLYEIEDIYKIISSENDDWGYLEIETTKTLDKEGDKIKDEYGGYTYLLKSITDKIEWLIEFNSDDYQGDLYYVGIDKEGKYYFLVQGYGSCSGCDMFLSAEYDCVTGRTLEPLNELRDIMKRNIIRFDSSEEFKEYLTGEFIKGGFYYYNESMKDFIKIVNEEFGWCLKWREDD